MTLSMPPSNGVGADLRTSRYRWSIQGLMLMMTLVAFWVALWRWIFAVTTLTILVLLDGLSSAELYYNGCFLVTTAATLVAVCLSCRSIGFRLENRSSFAGK
jgi:hypothetical protein